MRIFFMSTGRIGFSQWTKEDLSLAGQLWGDPEVTRYLCASGRFTDNEINERLIKEIHNQKEYGVQYWPFFALNEDQLIGCCGLRPFQAEEKIFELGFHLRKEFWGKGYAFEAADSVIRYFFENFRGSKLIAGHHPHNAASQKLLTRLGFESIGQRFYEPTGLYHPAYERAAKGINT